MSVMNCLLHLSGKKFFYCKKKKKTRRNFNNGYHFASSVKYISAAKFEEHRAIFARDILDSVFTFFLKETTHDVIDFFICIMQECLFRKTSFFFILKRPSNKLQYYYFNKNSFDGHGILCGPC